MEPIKWILNKRIHSLQVFYYTKIKLLIISRVYMSRRYFFEKERKILEKIDLFLIYQRQNISYIDEFRELFIKEHFKGNFPRIIFKEYGFGISVIGLKRVNIAGKR